MASSSNFISRRRAYNPIMDPHKKQKVSEYNRKWRHENPDKKHEANQKWRHENPNYNRDYTIRKHIEKYGYPPPPKKLYISKFEQSWKNTIELEFPNLEFKKIRPDWLKNPDTKCNLEIDLFCDQYNIAIEVSGRQHFEYTPKFHRDYDSFVYQLRKDRFKARRCKKLGIILIVISPDDKPSDILPIIHSYVDRV